jgi:putative PIN family toxin of toxin-antitoxin system
VRIALDSSVLIAAHVSRAGVCAELLEHVLLHHELVISEFILEEVMRKLREKLAFAAADVDHVAAFLRLAGTVVVPADLPATACRDPKDIPVLGTAIAGLCGMLISVDKDLLDLKVFRDIPVIRPGEFWRRADSASPS